MTGKSAAILRGIRVVIFCSALIALIAIPVRNFAQSITSDTLDRKPLKMAQVVGRTVKFTPGGSFNLSNRNGTIKVTAWDKPQAQIKATREMKARRGAFKTKQEADAYFEQLKVVISGSGKQVTVVTIYPERRNRVDLKVNYEISLPAKAQLKIGNDNGAIDVTGIDGTTQLRDSNGRIIVSKSSGSINVQTSNGEIICKDVRGRIDASTSNGRVNVSLAAPPKPDETLICKTDNGEIRVSLPAASAFNLTAGVENGQITSDFSIPRSGDKPIHNIDTAINGGGAKIDLATSNGAISIKQNAI